MSGIKPRIDPVRLMWKRGGLLLLMCVAVIGVVTISNVYRKERESAALRMKAYAHYADLAGRKDKLAGNIASLETDRGKEEALRNSYSVGRQGEGMIIIVDPSSTTLIQATSTSNSWLTRLFWWW